MSLPTLTHRPTRKAVQTETLERLNRDGSIRVVEIVTYRTSCACGRVFATGSELLTEARYLGHLPRPTEPTKGASNEQAAAR